jgi:hypothetical protein
MENVTCEHCGSENFKARRLCKHCSHPLPRSIVTELISEESNEIPEPVKPFLTPSTIKPLLLDCAACKTGESMTATSVHRFSQIVQIIGGLLLIPSFLGMAFSLLGFLSSITMLESRHQAATIAEYNAQSAAMGVGIVFFGFFGVVSLVGGLLGWLLLQKRKVWKCMRCNSIIDRG